ncbi:MAG: hypothetical protein ACOC9W_03645 [Persicimonas sp.]
MAKAPNRKTPEATPEARDTHSPRHEHPRPNNALGTGRYEPRDLAELMRYCKIVIQSDLCPRHIKSPADAMLIIQRGAELGLSAVNALQNLNVISGKVTMPAALAVGVVKASEACEYFTCIESTDEYSTWETKRRGNPEATRYTFSKHDAQVAGLWGSGTWRKYPRNLLAARASMNLARMEYQDVLVGVYTPEELDAPEPAPSQKVEPSEPALEEDSVPIEDQDQAPEAQQTQPARQEQAPELHWSELPVDEPSDQSEGEAWQKQHERFHNLMRINDVEEHLEAFRNFIKARHGIESWTQLPAELLTRWCDLIVRKSPTPSDGKPSDRAAWVERKLTRYAEQRQS